MQLNQEPARFEPAGPVTAYKTFSIASPRPTHTRPATCAEAGCRQHAEGWRVRAEGLPPGLLHLARTSGRKYAELQVAEGETWLVFEPGQPCFRSSEHRVPAGRPEVFLVRDGDWRGNPTGRRRIHQRPDDWVEDFAETVDRNETIRGRG